MEKHDGYIINTSRRSLGKIHITYERKKPIWEKNPKLIGNRYICHCCAMTKIEEQYLKGPTFIFTTAMLLLP